MGQLHVAGYMKPRRDASHMSGPGYPSWDRRSSLVTALTESGAMTTNHVLTGPFHPHRTT